MSRADANIVRAAEMVADHALLLLASGVALMVLALATLLLAAYLARRYRAGLVAIVEWVLGWLRHVPLAESAFVRARRLLPTRYMPVHLSLGLIATAAISAFVVIAEEVIAGRTVAAFDVAFATALQERASPFWRDVFRIVTWFGSTEFLIALSVPIALGLLLRHQYVFAFGWIVGQAGGALLMVTLKNAFERTRPEAAAIFGLASGWSFPSGHAMSTFIFCGLGAYLLARSGQSWTTAAMVITVALIWCVVMGFSRLYLGVHYVSDVIAGLIAATAWVAVCLSAVEVAVRRRSRTSPSQDS